MKRNGDEQPEGERNQEELLKKLENSINGHISVFTEWRGPNPHPNYIVNILSSLAKSPVFKKNADINHSSRRINARQQEQRATTSVQSEAHDVIDLDSPPSSPQPPPEPEPESDVEVEEEEEESSPPAKSKGQRAYSPTPSGAGPSSSKKRPRMSQNSTPKQNKTCKNSKTKTCQPRQIPELLKLIQGLLSRPYNKNMEFHWEEICQLTYEHVGQVDVRAAEFLQGNGLTLARECFDSFPWKDELILNIMIALGNLTEVVNFRPRLMTFSTVSMLKAVVGRENYNFKTNYRAASVLVNLFADGPKAWTIPNSISRAEILNNFRNLITSKWNVKTELISKGFEYPSLKCFIKILRAKHTPECILFGAWTIANLTLTNPTQYGLMLTKREEAEVWKLLNDLKTSNDEAIADFVSTAIQETNCIAGSVNS